jgi:hypothetical protein
MSSTTSNVVPGTRGRWSRLPVVGFAVAVCALAGGAGSLVVTTARADSATIDVTYTTPTSLQVTLADGTPVRAGSVIPAGSYTVDVKDDPDAGDLNPDFTITGPGVNVSNNLDSTGMGIDGLSVLGPFTFQASSSYSIEDAKLGASTGVTFTTSASVPASAVSTLPTGTSTSSSGSTTSTAAGKSGGAASTGSASQKILGTLEGSVSPSGKPSLSFDGKPVKTLKAGRYKVVVRDHSKKAGLTIGAVAVSGAAAAGASSHTVTLRAGKSFFRAAPAGLKNYFSITR